MLCVRKKMRGVINQGSCKSSPFGDGIRLVIFTLKAMMLFYAMHVSSTETTVMGVRLNEWMVGTDSWNSQWAQLILLEA